ncbi:hypothetical protein L1987_17401 [Smallanthus sonchifolius]|uniref:Uncharacterized protein n=1 Tax=Smallanthus sonchifolius TaxID=185202 RepID=A0ACB9IXP2_9ASTR|nr:hypothetical protein L1987_17401 [Smallanthus sonchifolius]
MQLWAVGLWGGSSPDCGEPAVGPSGDSGRLAMEKVGAGRTSKPCFVSDLKEFDMKNLRLIILLVLLLVSIAKGSRSGINETKQLTRQISGNIHAKAYCCYEGGAGVRCYDSAQECKNKCKASCESIG